MSSDNANIMLQFLNWSTNERFFITFLAPDVWNRNKVNVEHFGEVHSLREWMVWWKYIELEWKELVEVQR